MSQKNIFRHRFKLRHLHLSLLGLKKIILCQCLGRMNLKFEWTWSLLLQLVRIREIQILVRIISELQLFWLQLLI